MLKEEIFSQEQAWVRVRDPRWYRALSLTERLESRQAVSAPQTGEEAAQCELASMRMEQWNSQLAFTRGVDFAERLAADNLTEDDLLALLSESAEAIQRHTPVMSWMERLKSLFEDTDVPDEAEWLTRLSTQKLSLLNSVDLFLQDGLQRLGEAVSALVREYEQIPFHEERVVTLFLPALARPLIIAMNRTLVLELNVARLEDRLQGETPEERFQVDQYRVLSGGDQIFKMKVRGAQGIEQRQVAPLPFVEPRNLFGGLASMRVNELGPAIRLAIQQSNDAKGGLIAALIEPLQQFLKMNIDCQRLWLVNQLEA